MRGRASMHSLRALLVRAVLTAAALPLLLLALYLLPQQQRAERQALDRLLLVVARTAATALAEAPPERAPALLLRLATEAASADPPVHLEALDGAGRPAADGHFPAEPPPVLAPEVAAALATGTGFAHRTPPGGPPRQYVAVRLPGEGALRVVRASSAEAPAAVAGRRLQVALALTLLAVLVLSLAFAALLGRQVAGPVESLARAAARFAAGEQGVAVQPAGPVALRRLGESFNAMVARLERQVRSLDEAQGYLDAVIGQMPEGLLVFDATGAITRANAAAEQLLGQPAERIVGRKAVALLMDYSLEREIFQVLREGARRPGGAAVEARTAEGRVLRVSVGPLRVAGDPAGAVAILQDVSEMRRVEQMRRDFVANVSHELRTPVAAIRALAETLQLRGARRPELSAEYGPRIVAECDRMERLVSDLLLLAQTESGHLPLDLRSLDVARLAAEVVNQVEPLAAATGTCLELNMAPVPPVRADAFAAGQCLRNLVDNALRHAPGGTVTVSACHDAAAGQVVLSVRDDGPGIPQEELPRIFERFYRVDRARARAEGLLGGGSGLGLSIVRHLAEAQGGRAWVESRYGEGSTFYVALPVAPEEDPTSSRIGSPPSSR